MSRVINPESAGKERTQLTRSVILALRELMRSSAVDQETRDLAAYLVLALQAISKTIDVSVEAWEKRDYWLKADRFRMEWNWTTRLAQTLHTALLAEDWQGVALAAVQVGEKLKNVKVPQRHAIGTPWVGAYKRLQTER